MASPAGPCEWCGGPQSWTIISGEMYVQCVGGCLGLGLEDTDSLPDASVHAWVGGSKAAVEPEGIRGVVPCEGGDARTSDAEESEPPVGWLSSMWEGGDDGSR